MDQRVTLGGELFNLLKLKFQQSFGSRQNSEGFFNNLLPHPMFTKTINRRFVKLTVDNKYLPQTNLYFYKNLIHFMEFASGRKVYLKFNPFVETSLDVHDIARCYLWYGRVLGFQKILGHRIFVQESLKIFHVAVKYRDPTFLSN